MSRRDDQRLADILASAAAIADHMSRGGPDNGGASVPHRGCGGYMRLVRGLVVVDDTDADNMGSLALRTPWHATGSRGGLLAAG